MPQMQDNLTAGKAKSLTGVLTPDQKAKVDELAQIKQELDKFKPLEKKAEGLRKELLAVADLHFPDSDQAVLKGEHGTVIFSEKSERRQVEDLNGLIGLLKDKVGYEELIKMLKLTLSDIDAYLTPEESAPYIKKVTGNRTLKGVLFD